MSYVYDLINANFRHGKLMHIDNQLGVWLKWPIYHVILALNYSIKSLIRMESNGLKGTTLLLFDIFQADNSWCVRIICLVSMAKCVLGNGLPEFMHGIILWDDIPSELIQCLVLYADLATMHRQQCLQVLFTIISLLSLVAKPRWKWVHFYTVKSSK